ncbi:MJ1255/VC2487 family glycosyltransferase [Porticoccus sp.]
MKIFYGVQGTGNGHLSRARAMCRALSAYPDVQVEWLFSGRARDQYFDMESFGDFQCRGGLTFHSRAGRVQPLKTLRHVDLLQLRRDIRSLDLSGCDLVISDYEPITARAASHRGLPCVGIGHQYAFCHTVPERGGNPLVRAIMRKFAPVTIPVGLHWHHFEQPILPPIVDLDHGPLAGHGSENQVLIYLPFEDQTPLLALFRQFPEYQFYIYAPVHQWRDDGNLHMRPLSRDGFRRDLADSHWVICNAGFELISEALQLGKRIMAKPLAGQLEQLSNAAALEQLSYASVEERIDRRALEFWFDCEPEVARPCYPDVAASLARWIYSGCVDSVETLSQQLWSESDIPPPQFNVQQVA